MIQFLSCSNDLGSCCQDKAMQTILGPVSSIISIIQIIAPILLLIMVAVDLTRAVLNPDDKKRLPSIRNKAIAAVVIFFVPVFADVLLNSISTSGMSISSCLVESRNIKLDSKTSYQPIDEEDKPINIYTNSGDFEKGEKKPVTNSSSTGNGVVGTGPISTTCTLGDGGVKLVDNDSNSSANIVGKANGQEVANYARSWLGQGLTYDLGSTMDLKPGGHCDCSHFVYQVLKHFGIIDHQIKSTVWGSCNVKGTVMYSDVSKLVPGDVIFQGFSRGVGHVEIYIGNGESIGCNSGRGVTHGTHASSYTSFVHLTAYD